MQQGTASQANGTAIYIPWRHPTRQHTLVGFRTDAELNIIRRKHFNELMTEIRTRHFSYVGFLVKQALTRTGSDRSYKR